MVITRPKAWHVCDECGEWFHYPNNDSPEVCPNCCRGKLVKTCADCGKDFDKCSCKDK